MNPRRVFTVALFMSGAVAALHGCGSSSDGAILAASAGSAGAAGAGLSLGGASQSGGSGAVPAAGSSLAQGGTGGGVVNPGGKPPDAPCTAPSECASNRCEPVPTTTDVVCLGACFADGAPCTRALDCCSTGCFDGHCGGLCTVEGEDCASDAECCSNNCDRGRCAVDEANPDCRPTGEDCTSGTSRGCCHACDEETDRCGFPEGTCFAQGVACTADSECCRGACVDGTCRTQCTEDDGACAADSDCCSARCT
jgi:hypothetical protein